mgnify:CR=1 FL=1
MSCKHLLAGRICDSQAAEFRGSWVSCGVCAACPSYEGPARGLGDVIASATKAVGVEPCAPCQKRREALNQILPNPFKPG